MRQSSQPLGVDHAPQPSNAGTNQAAPPVVQGSNSDMYLGLSTFALHPQSARLSVTRLKTIRHGGSQYADQTTPSAGSAAYSDAIDNADKTINFLQSLDNFLGKPFSKRVTSNTRNSRLKRELGQWYDFLYEKDRDVYHNPMLSAVKFREYMMECHGAFRPVGKCLATAPWALLLHGLGITPKKNNILSRKVIHTTPRDIEIMLEVEGEVICHMINLLSLPNKAWQPASSAFGLFKIQTSPPRTMARDPVPRNTSGFSARHVVCVSEMTLRYETSIGDFVWEESSPKDSRIGGLSYSPSSDDEMNSPHHIFPDLLHRHSRADSDTLLAKYCLVLEFGTSNMSMVWPDPSTTSLTERFERLCELEKALVREREPMFLTETWKIGAERIVRRAAGGEQAPEFLKSALQCLAQHKEGADRSHGCEGQHWGVKDEEALDELYSCAANYLQDMLPVSLTLQYHPDYYESIPQPDAAAILAEATLNSTLEEFKAQEGSGSWRDDLCRCKDMVITILEDNRICVPRATTFILPLDRTTALWKQKSVQLTEAGGA